MSIKEFFLNNKEIKEAIKKKKYLEKKLQKNNSLNKKDKIAYEETSKIINSQRLKLSLLMGGVLLTGGAVTILISQGANNFKSDFDPSSVKLVQSESTESKLPDYLDILEIKTEILIKKVEDGFKDFEQKVMPLLSNIKDQETQNTLRMPFEMFHLNEGNPIKNSVTLEKLVLKTAGNQTIDVKVRNHVDFRYRVMNFPFINSNEGNGNVSATVAAFHRQQRTLLLSEEIDSQNILDMLIVYHELMHGVRDGMLRTDLTAEQFKKYKEFFRKNTHPPKINIREEIATEASGIEIFNLLLNNRFQDQKQNTNNLDIMALLNELNAPATMLNISILTTLINQAHSYYADDAPSKGVISQQFVNDRRDFYLKQGYMLLDDYPF